MFFKVPEPEKKVIPKRKPVILPPKKEEISFKKGILVYSYYSITAF